MKEMRGAAVAAALTEQAAAKMAVLQEKQVIPCLSVIRVGKREDDLSYERGIGKRFEKVGARVRIIELPEDVSQAELERAFDAENENPLVHGILLFRPLPSHLSDRPLTCRISPDKDVDGMCPTNAARVYLGDKSGFAPCTAMAVIHLLEHYEIPLSGAEAVVIGRSPVIGKPVSMLLLNRNATVTVCHTRTRDLAKICRRADLIVAAAGVAKMVGKEHLSENQVVVDVGIHMTEEGLCGDVDPAAAEICSAITPVPGGVGAVTTSVLLLHTVQAAERLTKED